MRKKITRKEKPLKKNEIDLHMNTVKENFNSLMEICQKLNVTYDQILKKCNTK